VRPSSGAAASNLPVTQGKSDVQGLFELTAPEDGRTPLKRRKRGVNQSRLSLRNLECEIALLLVAALLVCLPIAKSRADAPPPGGARGKVENFLLLDHEGKSRELYRQTGARAVVLIFTTTGCPIIEKSTPTIKALRDEFASNGVVFWLVDSNTEDDAKTVSEETRNFEIDLPVLLDHNQSVARSVGATRTAEAFCIEPKSWTLFYRGAIDDRLGYGTEKQHASHAYLENALNNFLAGKKIKPARTEVKGCLIHFEAPVRTGKK